MASSTSNMHAHPFTCQATAKSSIATERDQLLGAGPATLGDFSKAHDQRSKVLAGTERLAEGSRRLEEARRVALDTEQMGISTLEDLNRQRQQLERTANTVSFFINFLLFFAVSAYSARNPYWMHMPV